MSPAIESGRYEVFGQTLQLEPPVDWKQDPLDAHQFRQNFFKLRYLDPLLAAYESTGDVETLEPAAAIGLDFVANVGPGKYPYGEAWTDKVIGDRAPVVARLARDAACAGLLDEEETEALLASAEEHVEALLDPSRYVPDNHGLFVDLGLYRLAGQLAFLDGSERWQRLARERFIDTLRHRLAEGVWLEHSSAYHFLALEAVERFIALTDRDSGLRKLRDEMRAAAPWFVEPDGDLAQFGDSDLQPVPAWAESERREGMRLYRDAGYAFVRDSSAAGPAYLAVTAGFHNLTHKHADELSFELYDHGTRIVSDTGVYHKDPGRIRRFVVSPEAHSTLTVDDRPWPIDDGDADYGSGLISAERNGGWFVIRARNPLLRRQGVAHERTYRYRPGSQLVVIDRLRSDEPHTYTRRFQLGPEVRAASRPWGAAIEGPGFEGRLLAPGARARIVTGDRKRLEGLTSPSFRRFVARPTVTFRDRGSDLTLEARFDLDPSRR